MGALLLCETCAILNHHGACGEYSGATSRKEMVSNLAGRKSKKSYWQRTGTLVDALIGTTARQDAFERMQRLMARSGGDGAESECGDVQHELARVPAPETDSQQVVLAQG
jgi:hypothetical protein